MNAWTCRADAKTQLPVGSSQMRIRPYNGSLPRQVARCKIPVCLLLSRLAKSAIANALTESINTFHILTL